MEYAVNLMDVSVHPGEWARRREAQGWPILSVADHFFTANRAFPHCLVSASAMAMDTTDAIITTAFVNNLFRSPVEVAQAALQLQNVSEGRFELGLGAGWSKAEMDDAGLDFPEARDRAGSFIEATQIVRSLLHTGQCDFDGDYHRVHVSNLGPVSESPPPLVASVGGPRTVREVTPWCDRVEIKASSASTRGGELDLPVMAAIPESHLLDMIERVRAVDPDIPIGIFGLCQAGTDAATNAMAEMMSGGLYERFFGPPEHVAEGMAWLEEVGISRVQLSPFTESSLDDLAPLLLS